MTAAAGSVAATPGPWAPLRVTVYRWLWIAGLVSNVGTFMHLVAASWTMTLMTDSPSLVSRVQVAWSVPGFLLALHAGAFADRLDRRRFILATQVAALAIAVALAVMQFGGWLDPTWLLVGTFVESVALTMAAPAFMALTSVLVGADQLQQALGLDAISRNAAQAIGPALAGAVIAVADPAAVFALNAASFLGVIVVVQRSSLGASTARTDENLGAAIRDGVRRVSARAGLRNPLIRLAMTSAVGAGFTALMPLAARGRLQASAQGFGLLSACIGVGSVVAVWSLPRLRASARPEWAIGAAVLAWSAGVVGFAVSSSWLVAVPAVLLAGVGTMGMLNVQFTNYTLQLEEWMRGRGSALAMLMVWLGASVGAWAWGELAVGIGAATTLTTVALVNVAWGLVARLVFPLATSRTETPTR
jgi:MFS family permease